MLTILDVLCGTRRIGLASGLFVYGYRWTFLHNLLSCLFILEEGGNYNYLDGKELWETTYIYPGVDAILFD